MVRHKYDFFSGRKGFQIQAYGAQEGYRESLLVTSGFRSRKGSAFFKPEIVKRNPQLKAFLMATYAYAYIDVYMNMF